jgi:hypothetical protein
MTEKDQRLAGVQSDLAWLRDVYRRTKVIADEAEKLGKQLSGYERSWPAQIADVEDARRRVAALKLATKQLVDGPK